jgi:hypothetical protein
LHPFVGHDRARQAVLAELWPVATKEPDIVLQVGGFGVHGETAVPGWWVRSESQTLRRVAAAAVLTRRDRVGRKAAVRQVLALEDEELEAILAVDEVIVRAGRCDGHRLFFRQGGLHAWDHEHPRAGTYCRHLFDQWTCGTSPQIIFDLVQGAPPFYERLVDTAPELTRLRRILVTAVRHRILEDHGVALPWLHDRLRVEIGAVHDRPAAGWYGLVPLLWVRVPPSWLHRPTSLDLPLGPPDVAGL